MQGDSTKVAVDAEGDPEKASSSSDGPTVERLEDDPFLISDFEEHDVWDPKQRSTAQKVWITSLMGFLTMQASYPAATPAGLGPQIEADLHCSRELVASLISLFLLGYVVGPFGWGPASDRWGRKKMLLLSLTIYTLFQVAAALAPNIGSLMFFRLVGGIMAACPLANTAAVLSDLWHPRARGLAMALFSMAPFLGPAVAPISSGYIAVSGQSWRLAWWVLTGVGGLCLLLTLLSYPETYAPVLLARKAAAKRKATGDDRWRAVSELPKESLLVVAGQVLAKTFIMFAREPILWALCAIFSLMYSVMFGLFEGYPYVFGVLYGLNAGQVGLCFLPLLVGGGLACLACALYFLPRYKRLTEQYAPEPVPPEERLAEVMLAMPLLTISYWMFGWTAKPDSISVWVPMMSGVPQGFGILLTFTGLQAYILDAYTRNAATAIGISTITRALSAASFPLFVYQLYEALGPGKASSIFGSLSAVLLPTPFILRKYGSALRKKSRYADGMK